jgi:hypothetical protein
MVRELGVEAAEARPEESAQTPVTNTDAAKIIGVKFFMPQIPDFLARNWPRSRVPKFLAGRDRLSIAVAIEDQPLS